MKRAILITGEFSDEELKELYAAVRNIERRHQEEDYLINCYSPDDDRSMDEAMRVVKKVFPKTSGESVEHLQMKVEDFRKILNANPMRDIKPGMN